MADPPPPPPPLRVRRAGGGGAYTRVLLAPSAGEAAAERAVAGAVGLAPGSFFLRSSGGAAEGGAGVVAAAHAALVGDWDAVPLPEPAEAPAAAPHVDHRARFNALLARAGVARPRADVLERLHRNWFNAFITAAAPEEARHWYERARAMPLSPPRGRFARATGLLLDGPSVFKDDLLLAYDARGAAFAFKLVPARDDPEVVAALALAADGGCPGVVRCSFEEASHSDGSAFCGLLMRKLERSLATVPELVLAEEELFARAQALETAVRHVHAVGFVHMDIKEGNVFVDADGAWWLGDFGSCVREGEPITSTTLGLCPRLAAWRRPGGGGGAPVLARRCFDVHMLAGLLVRQLDAPPERVWGRGDEGPATAELRRRAEAVAHAGLRGLLLRLVDEADAAAAAAVE